MISTNQPLERVPVEAEGGTFPGVCFIAEAGRSLELHGDLLPANGELRDQFAEKLGIPGTERVLRVVPWIGLDSARGVTALVEATAQGSCLPVVRVRTRDATFGRDTAFAVRLVQALLTRFRPSDLHCNLSSEEHAGLTSGWHNTLPVPGTAREVVPCCTVRMPGDATHAEPARLCWRLVEGFRCHTEESPLDASVSSEHGNASFGTMTQSMMLEMDTASGYVDRPRDEVVTADRLLREFLLGMVSTVESDSSERYSEPELATAINAVLMLLCDLPVAYAASPLVGAIAPRSALQPFTCALDGPYGVALLKICATPEQVLRVLREVDEFFRQALGSLRHTRLDAWLWTAFEHVTKSLESCSCALPTDGPEYWCPPPSSGKQKVAGCTSRSLVARLGAWKAAITRKMAFADDQSDRVYRPVPGFTTLPLRYRFGLLLNPLDDTAVQLGGGTSPTDLAPRTSLTSGASLLPLMGTSAGQAFTAFAVRAGEGFLTVVPGDLADAEILRLVERAARRFGIGGRVLGSNLADLGHGPGSGSADTVEPPCCRAEELKVRIAENSLVIAGPTREGGDPGRSTIRWHDDRLRQGKCKSGASLDKDTVQFGLLMAMVCANGDWCKLTSAALEKAIRKDSPVQEFPIPRNQTSEERKEAARKEKKRRRRVFDETMRRLRGALARVIRPFVSPEAIQELKELAKAGRPPGEAGDGKSDPLSLLHSHLIPLLGKGGKGQHYELRLDVTVDEDAPQTPPEGEVDPSSRTIGGGNQG
ncbi:MAG: hypothetical protein HN904_25260 [Victivallales bacterium]|nr:hypothetical protein [Victivallales bacterium]